MPLASCDTQSEALRDTGSVPSTEDAGGGGLLKAPFSPDLLSCCWGGAVGVARTSSAGS